MNIKANLAFILFFITSNFIVLWILNLIPYLNLNPNHRRNSNEKPTDLVCSATHGQSCPIISGLSKNTHHGEHEHRLICTFLMNLCIVLICVVGNGAITICSN